MSSNSTLAYATITRLDGVPMEPVKIPIHWPKDESQLLNSESNEFYTRVVDNTLDQLLIEVDSGASVKYQEVKPFKCSLCNHKAFQNLKDAKSSLQGSPK